MKEFLARLLRRKTEILAKASGKDKDFLARFLNYNADMLAKARREAPRVAFQQADITHWSPPAPADLIFSNAALHWLDDHASLLPRLAAHLGPGGVLAVQVPCNRDSPSPLLMAEAAADGIFRAASTRFRMSG